MFFLLGFSGGTVAKILPASAGGFNPWFGKITWNKKWQPILVYWQKNPMDRRPWWAVVHGVIKS